MPFLAFKNISKLCYSSGCLTSLLILLVACSGPDEPSNSKEIRDEEGLNIDLEWETGGSSSQSISDVDLDLILLKGTTIADQSLSYVSFEKVELKDIYSDGEYIIQIKVVQASKASEYTVFINGMKSNDSRQYEGNTSLSDEGAFIEFITITKQGTKYVLSR